MKEEITVRMFDPEKDYPEIARWWSAQMWPVIPLEALPKAGFVAEKGDQKIAFSSFYFVEAGWAWLEWIVANPAATLMDRGRGVDLVIGAGKDFARKNGVKRTIAWLRQHGLKKMYERHGFVYGDADMTSMILGET